MGERADLKDRLKQLRLSRNMSQGDLAKLLGVDKVAVSQWERGVRQPKLELKEALCDIFNVNMDYLLGRTDYTTRIVNLSPSSTHSAIRIPVLGSVPAGVPIEAIEDIIDWEDLSPDQFDTDCRYFGLRIKGDSMYPKYLEADTVIVRIQSDCESGQDAVVYVNGYEATLKKVVKQEHGVLLQPLNPEYDPMFYSYDDVQHPVVVAGVVVEIRRKV